MRRPIAAILALTLLVLAGACSPSSPPPADDAAPPYGQDAVEGDL
jgi:hypothetical protein